MEVFGFWAWVPRAKKSFFCLSFTIWQRYYSSCYLIRTALLILFLLTKFCLQKRTLFWASTYSCSRLTFARWSEVNTRLLAGLLLLISFVSVEVTGKKRVSTSWRLVFLFPLSETAEDRNKFYIERILMRLSMIDSHLKSKAKRSKWDNLGGKGSLLSSLPY